MQNPVFPTIQTAYIFQKFANIDWKLYGKTNGQHMGIDIGVAGGQPGADIYAVQYGVVVESGYFEQGGYGRRVVIEHEDKSYSTLYAHLKDVIVKMGDVVEAGQKIGTMGGNLEDTLRGASGGDSFTFRDHSPCASKKFHSHIQGLVCGPDSISHAALFFCADQCHSRDQRKRSAGAHLARCDKSQ